MAPKAKVNKDRFDEYGFRILGDEDEEDDAIVADPKTAASKGCQASNDANKTLVPASNVEEKKGK